MKRQRQASAAAAAPLPALGKVGLLALFFMLSSAPTPVLVFVDAAQAYPYAFKEEQPDGRYTGALYITGGPDHHYVADENDFVIISEEEEDDDGDKAPGGKLRNNNAPPGPSGNKLKWKVYADRDSKSGRIKSSHLKVGRTNPRKAGLLAHLRPARGTQADRDECHMFCDDPERADDVRFNVVKIRNGNGGGGGGRGKATANLNRRRLSGTKTTGKLTNLVLLMRFADHPTPAGGGLPTPSDVEALMNAEGGHSNLAPTGSLRDYFLASSYGKLEINSVVTPWITLPQTESYYADNASGSTQTFVSAIVEALTILDSQHPDFFSTLMHGDGDGIVDSTMVLHSGYGAEWGQTDCRKASIEDRIWSHAWEIAGGTGWYSREGYGVKDYHTTSALWGICGTEIARIGTMAHELGHILGLADLYAETNGIGSLGVMANSWGYDGSQRYPPHMDPWSKIALGWIEPVELTVSGTYTIAASVDEPAVYVVRDSYPEDEYLLIENRQARGFDRMLPQGGLAIYHIDDSAPFTTRPGFVGQPGWPENGNHYRVAAIQADGTFDLEQNKNRGDKDDLWHASGPSNARLGPPFTDSYQGGVTERTNHVVENISFSASTMTFDLLLRGEPVPVVPPSATLNAATAGMITPPPPPVTLNAATSATRNKRPNNKQTGKITTTTATSTPPPPPPPQPQPQPATLNAATSATRKKRPNNKQTATITTTLATSTSSSAAAPGEHELSTGMTGDNGSYGCMFDVVARGKSIVVTALDTHTRTKTTGGDPGVQVEVRTKEGSHADYPFELDHSAWSIVSSTKIKGNGYMVPSHIPEQDFQAVTIPPHATQAFYVTLLAADQRYTNGDSPFGQPVASNDDLKIMQGTGIGDYPFGPSYRPRTCNTAVKYRVVEDAVLPTSIAKPTSTTAMEEQGGGDSRTNHQLETTFKADNGAHGSMFNVRVADADITIVGMDIHTKEAGLSPIEIYSKEDSYVGSEQYPNDWTEIFSANVQAQGSDKPTSIAGDKFKPVPVVGGKTQAFYVTMQTAGIRYTNGDGVTNGNVLPVRASDVSVSIEGGAGVGGYKFPEKTYDDRIPNVIIHYTKAT